MTPMPTSLPDCPAAPAECLGGTLRVVPIDNELELHKFAAAWERLAERLPFRGWVWNECWWRHYRGPGDRLNVLTLQDEANPWSCPWFVGHSPWLGRVIRFLGSAKSAPNT